MNNWEKWVQFSSRMVIYAMTHESQTEKIETLKKVLDFALSYKDTEIVGWDQKEHAELGYVCDYIDDFFYDGWGMDEETGEVEQTVWFGNVCAAIRAGLDVVLPDEWMAGVLGFTAGDVRKMYPEGLPSWLQDTFDIEYKTSFNEILDGELIRL